MFNRSVCWISPGRNYLAAAAIYAGLGVMMLNALPDGSTFVHANDSCGGSNSCAEGTYCCHGVCIPQNFICCDDGTSGSAEQCVCCTGCTETCSTPSTIACEE